ncbi:MAG: 8-oxo-dGTP diphosphatase [Clostridia bacterium]|nr:8-oxo-dGTP diphosphatase [Clostridia bacterium]
MIETTLCYLEQKDCYLLLHRIKKEKDINRDKWIGIGGKLMAGETPEACIRRETLEETGLTLQKAEYRGIVDFKTGDFEERMHLFWSDAFEGALKECDEGVLEWVPKSRMGELPQWEGDHIFLELLEKKAPFFHLSLVYEGDRLTKAEVLS